MRALCVAGVGAILFSLLGSLAARADEEKVPLDKLPKPISDAVKKRFPDAKLVGASKETEDKKTTFEVNITNKGQTIDVQLDPDGTITAIEKTIDPKGMPKAVANALDGKYPKAKLKRVEEVFKPKDGKENLEYYEILLVTTEKKTMVVDVAPEGKIVKEEEQKEK